MTEFVQGQRWVVDSEPELGLGTVLTVEDRTVTIFFESAEVERRYAKNNAPLTRMAYGVEDEIELADGRCVTVHSLFDHQGLIIYDIGDDSLVPETQLSSHVRLNQPYLRLLMGQIDKPKWFYFRRQLDDAISRMWQSRLVGLVGVRANLVPHQLYIAWTACEQERVRVLLADEVGLGKTIEAGLILTRLLHTERVHRALVVVPDALQVQWLVELVRRFNLTPTVYAGVESAGAEVEDAALDMSEEETLDTEFAHDFHQGQLHIVPHSALSQLDAQTFNAEFDMLIVDEAHNIEVDSQAFDTLKVLSAELPHVVLLTATPEQLGLEGHFKRLQLLDPQKFNSIEEYLEQEKSYIELNQRIEALPKGKKDLLRDYNLSPELDDHQVLNQLLDRHGVGRVMYRNVRARISGFPRRVAHAHQLSDAHWETRYTWLAEWLKAAGKEKALVIFHDMEQVLECEQYLWKKHGVDTAVFHEYQNLIERDKSAAYFSDMERGARVLLCSEIGSEGRNFQFACHLICMDLPDNPDLLEQRIGRLDRIGQQRDVNIHIPFAANSNEALKFTWYHEILRCVERQNPAAGAIHQRYWRDIESLNSIPDDVRERAKLELAKLEEEITKGRDALLEKNSCRQPFADNLASRIQEFERSTPLALVEMASDVLQFHFEATHENIYSLVPSDKMLVPALPGLPAEGAEITFSREMANAREDLIFVSWDAPLIVGLWEMLHHSELGSASVAVFNSRQLPEGHCLLETCYDIVVQSEYNASCRPFLDSVSLRTLVLDQGDKDLSHLLPEAALQEKINSIQKHVARDVIKAKKEQISEWYRKAEKLTESKKNVLVQNAMEKCKAYYQDEIQRLQYLSSVNGYVSKEEVDALEKKYLGIMEALAHHSILQLSAVRMIVVTSP